METVTEAKAVPVHPLASVTVTLPAKGGVTVMLELVSLVLQLNAVKFPLTLRVAFKPGQTDCGPAMAGVGVGKLPKLKIAVEVHPRRSVAITV